MDSRAGDTGKRGKPEHEARMLSSSTLRFDSAPNVAGE